MADVDTTNEAPLSIEEELDRLLPDPDAEGFDEAKKALTTRLLDECLDIVEYMRPVDQKNKRRIRLYLLLASLGVANKDIAGYLGVTAESVRQALLKARRGRDGT